MSPVLYIFFSGLIVFSPHKNTDGTYIMNTVLVNDVTHATKNPECDHAPTLRITGAAKVAQGSLCALVATSPQRQFLCFLAGGVTVQLDTERTKTELPAKPPQPLVPKDDSEAEGGSAGWLVRMSNIEADAAKHKTDILSMGDATFQFGWESANTCAFDIDEKGNIDPMMFVDGSFSNENQAVAEIVMFRSTIASSAGSKPHLKLTKGGVDTEVELDCSSGICPILEISNDVQTEDCPIDHFPIYYDFSDGTVAHPVHPERISAKGVKASTVTFNCEAKMAQMAKKEKTKKNKTQTFAAILPGMDPKAGDRLICPPIVMEE